MTRIIICRYRIGQIIIIANNYYARLCTCHNVIHTNKITHITRPNWSVVQQCSSEADDEGQQEERYFFSAHL